MLDYHLTQISKDYSNIIHVDRTYKSLKNHPQLLLRVTNFSENSYFYASQELNVPKVKILLSYGEHAREFLPVESLFYLLNNLTHGLISPKGSDAELYSRMVLSKIDLFIVAMMNPDGREYIGIFFLFKYLN